MSFENLTLSDLENMSDEDFQNIDPTKLSNDDTPVDIEPTDVEAPVAEQVEEVAHVEVEQPADEVPAEQASDAVPNEAAGEAEGAHAGTEQNAGGEAVETKETEATPAVEASTEKAFFDKVTSEFNANGKAFKIDNAEDVVSLMQKGLNYNQKMAAMKPGMKVLKALQERGIESVEDLGFLLDLQAKNPEAIARLVQESGVDAYELNEEKAQNYQPSVPQVSDELINFEMTAKALEGNPHFDTVVTQLRTYDDQTRKEIFTKPQLLNVLTEHVQNGYYDKICARLEQEQAVGRLQGMSFLQAYDTVGQAMFGAQPNPTTEQAVEVKPTPVATPVASKPKPSNNAARQAAAGNTSTATTLQKYSYTPEEIWNMSPDEFSKIDPKFL